MFGISENQMEENVQKKRRVGQQFTSFQHLALKSDNKLRLDSFSRAMVDGVYSDDLAAQLEATAQFREQLSATNALIEEVVLRGFVPRFVQLLGRDDSPQLQVEAAWVLRIIASDTSKYTPAIIGPGAVPVFVKLLRSASVDVCEQAVWALGNIAGCCPMFCNLVLHMGALSPLLALFKENSELPMLRNASWTLSNFCGGSLKLTEPLPVLERLIYYPDDEILANACWALAFLCGGAYDNSQTVIDSKFCPVLIGLLGRSSPSVLTPALLTLGFIAARGHTKTILEHEAFLPQLKALLTDTHVESIRKEVCTIISTVIAGTSDHLKAVIDAGLIPPLVDLLENAEIDTKVEAAWAISTLSYCNSPAHIKVMIGGGCIKPLHDLLDYPDPTVAEVCLDGLWNILEVAFGYSEGVEQDIKPYDFVRHKVYPLKYHEEDGLRKKSCRFLHDLWMYNPERSLSLRMKAGARNSLHGTSRLV